MVKPFKYLIDLDGTIYRGGVPIKYAKEFIEYLTKNNREFLIVTNCPISNPTGIVDKLHNMDINVKEENILTSSHAVGGYLERELSAKKVYVIGSPALKNLIQQRNVELVEENPDAVIVGYTTDFTYEHMKKATHFILAGAAFICTNPDDTIPDGDTFTPHTGSIAASIICATKKNPVIIGKPEKYIVAEALDRIQAKTDECCMIGDRLDTDVLTGLNYGMKSFLVLTGNTNKEMLEKSHIEPTKVFNNLNELMLWDQNIVKENL